jgi:hypothetical protein
VNGVDNAAGRPASLLSRLVRYPFPAASAFRLEMGCEGGRGPSTPGGPHSTLENSLSGSWLCRIICAANQRPRLSIPPPPSQVRTVFCLRQHSNPRIRGQKIKASGSPTFPCLEAASSQPTKKEDTLSSSSTQPTSAPPQQLLRLLTQLRDP